MSVDVAEGGYFFRPSVVPSMVFPDNTSESDDSEANDSTSADEHGLASADEQFVDDSTLADEQFIDTSTSADEQSIDDSTLADKQSVDDSTSADKPLIDHNPSPKFRYDILHDLESILWITIRYLFHTVPAKPSQELTQEVLNAIEANALKEFPQQSFSAMHLLMIIDSTMWSQLTCVITKDYKEILELVNKFWLLYYAVAQGTYKSELGKDGVVHKLSTSELLVDLQTETPYMLFRKCLNFPCINISYMHHSWKKRKPEDKRQSLN